MTKSHWRTSEQMCVFLHHQVNSAHVLHHRGQDCCPRPSPTSPLSRSITGANSHSHVNSTSRRPFALCCDENLVERLN